MNLTIDRSLPFTLVDQIKGQIIYAISDGKLGSGARMPSLRELAAQLDIAQMTIARVYRELADQHLLETRPGVGTFIADITRVDPRAKSWHTVKSLQQLADAFVRQALAHGHTARQIRTAFPRRLQYNSRCLLEQKGGGNGKPSARQ